MARERRGEVSVAAATVLLLDEWVGLAPADPAASESRRALHRLPARPSQPERQVGLQRVRVDVVVATVAVSVASGVSARSVDVASFNVVLLEVNVCGVVSN